MSLLSPKSLFLSAALVLVMRRFPSNSCRPGLSPLIDLSSLFFHNSFAIFREYDPSHKSLLQWNGRNLRSQQPR
jgi:hypothetical protein